MGMNRTLLFRTRLWQLSNGPRETRGGILSISISTYHHNQQQQEQQLSQSSMFSRVKVELQQLILSILDDPIVSRVVGEAGFRSCDIKYAVLRPPPTSILRFPRSSRCPPLFLCNFSTTEDESNTISRRSFSFPFSRQMLYSDGSDENCKRIGEVIMWKNGRNPLRVEASAADALQDVAGVLRKEKWSSMPQEIVGSQFLDEGSGREEEKQEGLEYLVSELTRLIVGGQNGRVWLVGSSTSYETYMMFIAKFPSLDKDWDLQLLPTTSTRGSI